MATRQPEFLTVRELAELLRVKQRKVYALAASGEIPCSRATGKILFPRGAVDSWLARHGATGAAPAAAPAERSTVMVGSHDPLLDWALRESRSGIASFFDGSLDGLARFVRAEAVCAGMHIFEDGGEGWNARHVAEVLGGEPVVLIEWAWRERGLIVPRGNPLGLREIADLRRRRVVPRQPEAASQQLLLHLLACERLSIDDIVLVEPPARNETDLALAVADGKADAAFGLTGAARPYRLDFVPLMRERYDLLVWRRFYFEAPFQRLMRFCRGPAFAARAADFGGYDVSGFGTVRFNGD